MKDEYITYKDGEVELEGYLALPKKYSKPLPLVMICHAWAGRDEFAIEKAKEIAKLGYAGFALDVYGKGIHGQSPEENSKLMAPFMDDRELLKKRLWSALKIVRENPNVDEKKIVSMGYCFGGLCSLDLARSGADILAAISIHGLFSKPTYKTNINKKTKVLALHGYDDPMVSPFVMLEWTAEMKEADIDWQLHAYGQTSHAFSHPDANDKARGCLYHKKSSDRSWLSAVSLIKEVFS